MKSFLILLLLLLPPAGFTHLSSAPEEALLQSGPMLGYSEMKEVLLWVQTRSTALVKFSYWEKALPQTKYFTEEARTSKETAFTARLTADEVLPGKTYAYELYINGAKIKRPYPMEFKTRALPRGGTNPPAFRIAIGSCNYVNDSSADNLKDPYGGGYGIFGSIYEKHPDLMLWLGDNVYLRAAGLEYAYGNFLQVYSHTFPA